MRDVAVEIVRGVWHDMRGRGGFDFELDEAVRTDIFKSWYKIAARAINQESDAVPPDNIVQLIEGF